jgi:CDP-glucose 4,6-dehydratase
MHYFVTGHTGFKGAWLVLLLSEAGHTVSGMSLDPESGSLFEVAGLASRMAVDGRGDIRDATAVGQALGAASPDVVVHLAAQPLVRESYRDPRFTIETNVNGTFNVLEAVSRTDSVQAHLVITTDKVYRNVNRVEGYREDESLGGSDPYSASKAMADILIQSWTQSFPGVPTAIARAGNVIGGGDVSKDRLLPDLLRSFAAGTPAVIRYPDAVRPWQHVLDCLDGYLLLIQRLLDRGADAGAWNFGPGPASFATVAEVSALAATCWGEGAEVVVDEAGHPHEAAMLTLDASKARSELGWVDRLTLQDAVGWTVSWQQAVRTGASPLEAALGQVVAFAEIR